jgi:membrane-bound lytic murein transglycosylase D
MIKRTLLLAVTLLAGPTALAQEESDDAEVAEEPVAAPTATKAPESTFLPPRVDADPERRRAIRGAYPPEATIDPEEEALREFEQEAFAAGPAAAEAKPLEDRPDIEWLKKLRTGDVPVHWDRRVIKFLEFYRDDPRGRALMTSWLKRQGRFKDMILSALRRHGLPEDLIYISMIESSYDPLEVSRVGASGLWQFMPAAGRVYALRQDHWIDERFDPEKANEAQMLYFKDLYARFGNWELAAAAFNCGYGCVLKSMAKYGTNDFWALLDIEGGLPWESSVYVPKFLAAAVVGRNLAAFGFDHVVPNDRWAYDKVTVPASVDLATVARAAGVDLEAVKRLNPALRRGRTPPGVVDYEVRIPEGTQERFARSFPQLRLEWEGTETYVIRHGERFEDVAATYGISQTKLRELNGVRDIAEVRGGTILVVPSLDAEQRAKNRAAAEESLYHSDVVPGGPTSPCWSR